MESNPLDKSVLSPFGFDINCAHPDTKVGCSWGSWKKIKDLESDWKMHNIRHIDLDRKGIDNSNILLFMEREEKNYLYEITTSSGRKVKITGDHPVLTRSGMINASQLKIDDPVFVHAFEGVEYEEPSDDIIVSKSDIERVMDRLGMDNSGNRRSQILKFLEKRDLLDIQYNSPKLPLLLKLMGFILGDGVICFVKGKKGFVHFYGKKEDLDEIKKDLSDLGFKSSIYSRERSHSIKTFYGNVTFDAEENSIIKKSNVLSILLVALGVPHGNKTHTEYRVPEWIFNSPLWQKRLFIASFFGAELSTPSTLNKYNFYQPQLNMNKSKDLVKNGKEFLNDIRLLLADFGITSSYPVKVSEYCYSGKRGESIGLRIMIHGNPKNLVKLFETVGYEYNKAKYKEACLAANYIRTKECIKKHRSEVRESSLELKKEGMHSTQIKQILSGEFTPTQFISHSLSTQFKQAPRIASNFMSFEEYKKYAIGDEGLVEDSIKKIRKVHYNGFVYDFTMDHPDHNFIANGIVTHNCGMTMLTTNLTLREVQPKLRELVDTFFKTVPSGVGTKSLLRPDRKQFDDIMTDGVKWCVDNGYGWEEDIGKTENNGKIEGADPSIVSPTAVKRGIKQVGTLGSGNHYLEVQVAEQQNIFDPEIAKVFGITKPEQVVVMFHCGSRGFGHQIATDYLKVFTDAMPKYGLKILDRELTCAPFQSQEGQDYYKAMACAANMAFANRQTILAKVREGFEKVFGKSAEDMEMKKIYDVAHNIAKIEKYKINGKMKEVIVHRKGATRSFGPGQEELPKDYQKTGQPVILGGSMETGSHLLVGTQGAMDNSFGSTAHGSGRTMSRTKAKKLVRGDKLQKDLLKRGIYIRSASMSGLAEEAGLAYKDINRVVDTIHNAGISKKVVGLRPIGNVKG